MNDNKKTKAQMLDELADLRRQVRKQEKLRKSLEKSEEKYRATVNSIEEGYYEVDLTGKYTFIDPAAGKFHGHSPDELIGTSYSDYTTPETADRIFQIFNEIYRTGHPKKIFDYQLIHRDGKIRDLEISVSLIRDAEGNPIGFRGIGWDATERKIMEAKKERYRDFFENIEESCFEQDLAGNYTFINEAACRRFGYTREEILGMNFHDLTTPETAEKLVTVFNQVYQTGTPSELLDIEVFDKGKKPISIQTMASLIRDPGGNPIGFRGVARDITERKKMEVDQERYRDFIENMDDACFEVDLAGGIIFNNNVLPRMLGYTPEEYWQLKREERYASPEEAQRIFKIYNDMYRKGKRGIKFYASHRSKEGKIQTLEVLALLVRDAEGNSVGFRGIGRDVTEQKKMELEQRRYQDFIENITDGCFENDLAENVIFVN
jgi:PAS domain S-box-containing protein